MESCGGPKRPAALAAPGDRLGAIYTPLALVIAAVAYALSARRPRLSVLVVATPCP
jgi:hypothetical protein